MGSAGKGLACDFLPYVPRCGHMLGLYIVYYHTYIVTYIIFVYMIQMWCAVVKWLSCTFHVFKVYSIVYYTSGHMLWNGMLRTWKPTQVKLLDSSDSHTQPRTHSFRLILIFCFLVAIYGKELAMTVLWMLFIFLIRHATASHQNLNGKRRIASLFVQIALDCIAD